MENKTLVAGLTKGFKLKTFRIKAESGAEFEYVVENLNEMTNPHDIEELRMRKLAQEKVMGPPSPLSPKVSAIFHLILSVVRDGERIVRERDQSIQCFTLSHMYNLIGNRL